MLTFEQIKAIEAALGAEKAAPVIQVLETLEERVKTSLATELTTKRDLEAAKLDLRRDLAEAKLDIVKWVAGMLVAQAAVIAALVKLL